MNIKLDVSNLSPLAAKLYEAVQRLGSVAQALQEDGELVAALEEYSAAVFGGSFGLSNLAATIATRVASGKSLEQVLREDATLVTAVDEYLRHLQIRAFGGSAASAAPLPRGDDRGSEARSAAIPASARRTATRDPAAERQGVPVARHGATGPSDSLRALDPLRGLAAELREQDH